MGGAICRLDRSGAALPRTLVPTGVVVPQPVMRLADLVMLQPAAIIPQETEQETSSCSCTAGARRAGCCDRVGVLLAREAAELVGGPGRRAVARQVGVDESGWSYPDLVGGSGGR